MKTLLSHLGDCIFSHVASGVLQTYFFLCNGFLIRKVQQVKVISDKRQSHGLAEHVQTHLHVKNRAESMTWAHSFRTAREFRLNWCNSKAGKTQPHCSTVNFPSPWSTRNPFYFSPSAVRAWDVHTQKCIFFFFFFCPPGIHQMNIHQHCLAFMLRKWRMPVWIQSRNSMPSPSSGLSHCVCQSCDKQNAIGWGLDMLTKE